MYRITDKKEDVITNKNNFNLNGPVNNEKFVTISFLFCLFKFLYGSIEFLVFFLNVGECRRVLSLPNDFFNFSNAIELFCYIKMQYPVCQIISVNG